MPTFKYHQDTRDGRIYKCVLMPDGKRWSASDYRWDGSEWISPPNNYYWDSVLAAARLYRRSTLTLPPGTHLPTAAEWSAMVTAAGAMSNSRALRSALGWGPTCAGDDIYGFGIIGANGCTVGSGFGSTGYTAMLLSTNGVVQTFGVDGGFFIGNSPTPADYYGSVRFIVDTFNEPDPFKLFGAPFQGFERGFSVKLNRAIDWIDTIGGTARGIPKAPAIYDEWEVDAELWVNAAQATAIEAAVPPFGVPVEQAIQVPARGGDPTFAGLLPHSTNGTADLYQYPEVRAFASMGRKGPRLDLYGYKITFALRCFSNGVSTNPQTAAPNTTVPAWLVKKFASHQLQDWSNQSVATGSASQGASSDFRPVKHGRRTDINFNLDHLTVAQASELVQFFRGVRHNSVTISVDKGPAGIQAVAVRLKGLSLQRGAGLWWDGSLEMVLA